MAVEEINGKIFWDYDDKVEKRFCSDLCNFLKYESSREFYCKESFCFKYGKLKHIESGFIIRYKNCYEIKNVAKESG